MARNSSVFGNAFFRNGLWVLGGVALILCVVMCVRAVVKGQTDLLALGITLALVGAADLVFLWASRRVRTVHWQWERRLFDAALGGGRSPVLCVDHGVARAQGRALGCATGAGIVSVLRSMSNTVTVAGNELVLETEADMAHLGVHYGMLVSMSDLLMTIASDGVRDLQVIAREDTSHLVGRRASAIIMDVYGLHRKVNEQAKLLGGLLRRLKNTYGTSTIPAHEQDEIRRALRSVGLYLAARGEIWLKGPRDLAALLHEALRKTWEKDRDDVVRECG